MQELRPGIWHWQSPHPDWGEDEWWPELVSSYAIELGGELLLIDPLAVPDELRARATAVLLTAPYHERDARKLGLPVHTPPADTWQDWVEKFGVDPDRVRGMESDDLAWLRAGEGEGHFRGPERGRSASTRTRAVRTTISSSGCSRSTRSSPATRFPTSALRTRSAVRGLEFRRRCRSAYDSASSGSGSPRGTARRPRTGRRRTCRSRRAG